MKDLILNEYRAREGLYSEFKEVIINLLKGILSDIPIQQISGRVKEYSSLEKKIDLKNKYNKLDDITDIIGIRVITYLPNSVDSISKIINSEFKIDKDNSVDKRIKEYDRFGYMSLHLVCELDDNRIKLTEYKRFKNIKFEIQVRSILQHAWAEIEHDIGYKSEREIPNDFKRRFFRLSSLLELADEEFQDIVDEIKEYSNKVSQQIKTNHTGLELNKNTLLEYTKNSKILKAMLDNISKGANKQRLSEVEFYWNAIEKLNFIGCLTVDDLDNDLKEHQEIVTKLAIAFLNDSKKRGGFGGAIGADIGIFYLVYFKILEANKNKQDEYIIQFHKGKRKLLEDLKRVYDEVK